MNGQVGNLPLSDDASAGYEAIAEKFMRLRSTIGTETARTWARTLPRGGTVLDLGCGDGKPISEVLATEGLVLHGVDASATLLATFQRRFPGVPVARESVEASDFFGRRFDGVIAWGLMFLLSPASQRDVIRKVSNALNPGGHFLFTAPSQVCEWKDVLTGRVARSLGREAYHHLLLGAGLTLIGEPVDEGGNHGYAAQRAT